MRIDASRLKYLAFLVGVGACFFDPQGSGPGALQNPTTVDGGSLGTSGTAAPGTPSGSGGGGQAGDGTIVGAGAVSGGAAGASGSGGAGQGGMSGGSGEPAPPLLVNGEVCIENANCESGHCDGICCDKGAECCRDVSDCTRQPGGLGMSCDDRTLCRGTAGTIECTPEFKCVTINGARNDGACTNRIEASDCGPYLSVYCRGGELQNGAPECATSCLDQNDCDPDAHCDNGACVPDFANGEPCRRNDDCTAGSCKNVVDGMGICCGFLGDCCKTPDDCPDTYRSEPMCNDPQNCRGTQMVAQCTLNLCTMMPMQSAQACQGMPGPDCGLYQNITCMANRDNTCRTSCTSVGDCDRDRAFCDDGECREKLDNGQPCESPSECASENCINRVCCVTGGDCCSENAQCRRDLDLRCTDPAQCEGSRATARCMNGTCSYNRNQREDDDSACAMSTPGGGTCGFFRDLGCNGMASQTPECETSCNPNNANTCDANAMCRVTGEGGDVGICVAREVSGGMNGNGNGNGG